MQHQSAPCGAVEAVADDRPARLGTVNPNLMCTPGDRASLDQDRAVAPPLEGLELRDRLLAAGAHRRVARGLRPLVAPEEVLHPPTIGRRCVSGSHDGAVALVDVVLREHPPDLGIEGSVGHEQHEPGRVDVEAVMQRDLVATPRSVPRRHGTRQVRARGVHRGVHGEPRRLADDEQTVRVVADVGRGELERGPAPHGATIRHPIRRGADTRSSCDWPAA